MLSNVISILSLLIAIVALVLNYKNRQTTVKGYLLSRHAIRSSQFDLLFVSSTQLDDSVLIKLAVFNPGSIAILIKSMTVFRKQKRQNSVLAFFFPEEWVELENVRWWPSDNDECKKVKTVADAYKLLYVQDQRDINVLIPGFIDRNTYQFHIATNHGGQYQQTRIDSTECYFPHFFEQSYHE
jgi:hypothetical protein